MLTFLPLHVEHLLCLTPHDSQQIEYQALVAPHGQRVVESGLGLSAWAYGRCVGAGGVVQIWQGRAEAWGIFGAGIAGYIRPVASKIKLVLDDYPCRRLELTVKAGNKEGHRIARLLGFGSPESVMRAYHPDGTDMYMYARIKQCQGS